MMQWYALHTRPRSERRVALILGQRSVETFLPEIVSTTTSQQRKIVAFFPGYLFAQLDLEKGDPTQWRWTPGLRHVVAYGDQPIPVPEEVIRLIEHKLSEMALSLLQPRQQFEPGDMVRIKDGPFRDMLAIFEGPMTPSARVQVLLTSLNRAIRVRIESTNLEKVAGTTEKSEKKRPRRTRGRGRRIG